MNTKMSSEEMCVCVCAGVFFIPPVSLVTIITSSGLHVFHFVASVRIKKCKESN